MRITRAMMVTVVFGAAMLIIPLGGTTPPSSQAYEELIVELNWNAAGNTASYGDGDPFWLSTKLRPYIENSHPYPTVITLQEVCRQQVVELFTALPSDWSTMSYAFWAAFPAGTSNVCNGGAYGNATLIYGGGSNSEYEFINQDEPVSVPGRDEIRGIACVNGSIGGALNISACSMHASAAFDSVANAQVAEAEEDVSAAVATGLQYVVGGDFNLSLADGPFSGLDAFYQSFDEGDALVPPGGDATHDSEGKIDYLFLSRNTPGVLSDTIETAVSFSDHHIMFTELLINMPD